MSVSKKILKSIMRHYLLEDEAYQDGKFRYMIDELVEDILVELNLAEDIEYSLRVIKGEEQMLKEEHEKAWAKLQVSKMEAIRRCRHHSKHHRDGTPICDTCGKEVEP